MSTWRENIVRIQGWLLTGSRAYIGPSGSSGLAMSAVQVIVEGVNGGSSPDSLPPAAEIGSTSDLKGYVFVPNGTLALRAKSNSIGKFVAKDIDAGNDADVRDGTGIVVLPGAWVSGQRWPLPVLTALNSLDINQSVQVKGDVAVITAATGATLTTSYEASLASGAVVTGNLQADSALIRPEARVTGSVTYNNLTNNGSAGSTTSPLSLPLDITAPAFPAFSAGTTAVVLAATLDTTLAPGSYGLTRLRGGTASNRTVLTLTGGVYNVADIDLGDYATIECAAACELRVKNRIAPGSNDFYGPKAGVTLDVSDVRIFVEGKNSGDAAPGTTPYAAVFGQSCIVSAYVFVPNGTLQLRASSVAKGRFVARDIALADLVKVDAAGSVITPPPVAGSSPAVRSSACCRPIDVAALHESGRRKLERSDAAARQLQEA